MQSPLQPLQDNLESTTYETFERDSRKYEQYQLAIEAALKDRVPDAETGKTEVTKFTCTYLAACAADIAVSQVPSATSRLLTSEGVHPWGGTSRRGAVQLLWLMAGCPGVLFAVGRRWLSWWWTGCVRVLFAGGRHGGGRGAGAAGARHAQRCTGHGVARARVGRREERQRGGAPVGARRQRGVSGVPARSASTDWVSFQTLGLPRPGHGFWWRRETTPFPRLDCLRAGRWEDRVTIAPADMRAWQAPAAADILVSELLVRHDCISSIQSQVD